MINMKKGMLFMLLAMLLSLCSCGSAKYPPYFQKIIDGREQGAVMERDYGLQVSYQDTYSEDIAGAYSATAPRPTEGEFDYRLNWLKAEDGTVLENLSFDLESYIQSGECGTGGVFYEEGEVTIVLSVLELEENVTVADDTLVIEFNTENPAEYVVTVLQISSWFEGCYRVADKLCINNGAGVPIHQIDMETKEVYCCEAELETAQQYAESMSDALGKEVSVYWLYAADYVEDVTVYSGTVQEEMDSERLASIYLAYEGETLVGVLMIDSATGEITYITPEDENHIVVEAKDSGETAIQSEYSEEEIVPTDTYQESTVENKISMEDIICLSEKENLTVGDVTEWSDIQSMETNGFYYEFLYEGAPYRLDIIQDSDGSLASVRLVDMNTYLSIDIRTGSIDNLLTNAVSIVDYLTVSLPDGWTVGDYDIYLGGHFGGSQILDKQGNLVGDILIMHGLNPAFSGDELIDIGNYDNNVFFLEKEAITQIYVPCILTLMSEESEGVKREYRCAYFAQEGCDIYYQIKVNSDYISDEEMIDLLETVVFTERAFY